VRYLTTTKTKVLLSSFVAGALYVFVAMVSPQPASAAVSCTLSAGNSSIPRGSSTSLSWSRSGGGSLVGIDPIGYSSTATSGSTVVSPSSTTTYKLTVDLDSKCTRSVTVTVTTPVTVTCGLSASSYTINSGQSATLSWSSSGGNNWGMSPSIGTVGANGSQSVSPTSTTTYSFYVNYGSPSQCTRSVTITVNSATVSCDLSVNTGIINSGQSVTLSWSSSGGSNWGMSPSIGTVGANGSRSVSPTSTTTYSYIVNMGSPNQCMKSVTVTVRSATGASCVKPQRTPEVADAIVLPNSTSTSVTVPRGTTSLGLQFWLSGHVCRTDESPVETTRSQITNATIRGPGGSGGSVSGLSGQIPQLNYTWTNGYSTFDTRNFTVMPTGGFTQSGTYTITVTSIPMNYFPEGGTYKYGCVVDVTVNQTGWNFGNCSPATATFTVNVTVTQADPQPDCTLTANPTRVSRGGSSTLRWTSSGGTSWGFADTTQTIGASGSRTVSPATTTTYYFLVVGPGGHRTCPVTVVVDDDPPPPPPEGPTCLITVSPARIDSGSSVLVTWSSNGATAATLNGELVGFNNTVGTIQTLTSTTSYVLVVYGPGGSSTCATRVEINGDPSALSCEIFASPEQINSGGSSTISWSTNNATSFTINGVSRSTTPGSFPTEELTANTIYRGIVRGSDGSTASCEKMITVIVPPTPFTGPYHKVYGGDVTVGGGFGDICEVDASATILGSNKLSGGNYVGAGTQLAAMALGVINGFGSSQSNTPAKTKQLTLANTEDANAYGGNLNPLHKTCAPDFWVGQRTATEKTASSLSIATLDAGANQHEGNVTFTGGNLALGQRKTLYVEGNVRITGNITYNLDSPYTSIKSIPSFRLIVKGNIYVDPDVTELNGVFVAMPNGTDDTTASGRFYTCSPDMRAPNAGELASCNNLLTVYGSVLADLIKFTRTRGTVDNATTGERYNNNLGSPAEKFIYTPETWLTSDFGGIGDNDAFVTLPPVL
jgi:hypothetical protein